MISDTDTLGGCSFTTTQARIHAGRTRLFRCQYDWLFGNGQEEYATSTDGTKWCPLHDPNLADEDPDYNARRAALEKICGNFQDPEILDLSGLRLDWNGSQSRIDIENVFGCEMPSEWGRNRKGGVFLDKFQSDEMTEILNLEYPDVPLKIRNAAFKNDLIIKNCNLREIDLLNTEILGNLRIEGCSIGGSIILHGVKVSGTVEISGFGPAKPSSIGGSISFDQGVFRKSVDLRHLRIGEADKEKPALLLDSLFDDADTQFASLSMNQLVLVGDILFGDPKIYSKLEMQNLHVMGHVVVGDTNLPDCVFIRDLAMTIPPSAIGNAAADGIRYRREFHVLSTATRRAGDIEGTAQLIRLRREVDVQLGNASLLQRIGWHLHEIASGTNESWIAPMILSALTAFASLGISAALVSLASRAIDWPQLLVLTLSNTFLPFSFTDLWFTENLPIWVLIVATAHSALSVGLIAAIVMAVRARQMNSD